ncbi:methylmalonyl Co-A mutase-associated GTPase MeaB [Maribacter hydrothermalis]|uniref:ATPase/protein kinase n=1 Tax=Maribacter hydrothermalis TaxID=1836467 RepID=A0A1B7Z1S8_9FLAO|nr:methylmalonyl Co-A mutase-associated GTPase MeaB [Maribacter hydrothermalis]APQ18292.1 ATPase/protein kinase [Maribacter hydrothermalis]OBR36638.1 ATPase/protein kinase [Maribacter hydrothermalis]
MKLANLSTSAILEGIYTNNVAIVSKAITIIESTKLEHRSLANEIIEGCISKKHDTLRIGITGVPGAGKSTFIEQFGGLLTNLEKKVAVLTVDPTSSRTKGSILGDKTRMQELVKNPNVYIRPSASGTSLGGVARKTRESIVILEAARFDIILIETVGVGQSETAVHDMVDFFLLLKLAGAGDELQGIKRGIIEMADTIVINKADGKNIQNASQAKMEFSRALHMFPPKENGWTPKVLTCSALENKGLNEIWQLISNYNDTMKQNGFFFKNRQQQNENWLIQYVEQELLAKFYQNPKIKELLPILKSEVIKGNTSPFKAAEKILRLFQIN